MSNATLLIVSGAVPIERISKLLVPWEPNDAKHCETLTVGWSEGLYDLGAGSRGE
jgi:hypothetical protein